MLTKDVLVVTVLAFIVVGFPALVLKLTTIWFVRSDADKPRIRLLALSVAGSSFAGLVTIVCYSVLSRLFEFAPRDMQFSPKPFVFICATAILVGLVAAVDFVLWRNFARNNGAQSIRTKAAWLFAGNAWIVWAVWLMNQYRWMQQFD